MTGNAAYPGLTAGKYKRTPNETKTMYDYYRIKRGNN
jgi:hypothetical protein